MKEIIIASVVLIVFFGLFVFTYFFFKGINAYKEQTYKNMMRGTKEVFMNMKIVDNKYLPYYPVHGYMISYRLGASNTKDAVTGMTAKKNFCITSERSIYICNNQIKYPYNIVEKYDRKFIELNDEIKHLEILISFAYPEHFLFKMDITKKEDSYILSIKEEGIPNVGTGTTNKDFRV